jgi:hypothetical protein
MPDVTIRDLRNNGGRVLQRVVRGESLNLGASLLLMLNTYVNRAYPSAFVNLVWMGIAAFALVDARRSRRN